MTAESDPDVQAVVSRKYLAAPVAFVPHGEGYALFTVHGAQRTLVAIGPWHALEEHLPPLLEGVACASPWNNEPPPATRELDINTLLDDLDL